MSEIEELRLKIKKLKYKLEKQEKHNHDLKQHHDRYRQITKTNLSLERVLKKINFLLQLKGMHIVDWLHASAYLHSPGEYRLGTLVEVLEHMGLRLEAGERALIMNLNSANMSEVISEEEIVRHCGRMGIRTE